MSEKHRTMEPFLMSWQVHIHRVRPESMHSATDISCDPGEWRTAIVQEVVPPKPEEVWFVKAEDHSYNTWVECQCRSEKERDLQHDGLIHKLFREVIG